METDFVLCGVVTRGRTNPIYPGQPKTECVQSTSLVVRGRWRKCVVYDGLQHRIILILFALDTSYGNTLYADSGVGFLK